ncbi:MAG: ParB N-terminal domain-containing protein, partial [Oscillospiraceae bacterium]|nr:ParB N-terminal domain-containing protein [Oscillospiraceae bacterium]
AQYGVLVPAIVRPAGDGRYQMIAGHRRKEGCEINGLVTIPCIVRNYTDDEATIIMVDSNLQREMILPSEKSRAYKMRRDAMKRQAGRPCKENYSPVGNNFSEKTSVAKMAEQVGESKNQIYRYISLAKLIPELLQMVDDWALRTKDAFQIAMRPAVDLADLPEEAQHWVLDAIRTTASTPSHAQTRKMLQFRDKSQLNKGVVCSIMEEEKPNQAEKIKIPRDTIARFFKPDTSPEKITATIIQALELLQKSRTMPPPNNDRGGHDGRR